MVGKAFPAFQAHVQPAILRIWQEVHCMFILINWVYRLEPRSSGGNASSNPQVECKHPWQWEKGERVTNRHHHPRTCSIIYKQMHHIIFVIGMCYIWYDIPRSLYAPTLNAACILFSGKSVRSSALLSVRSTDRPTTTRMTDQPTFRSPVRLRGFPGIYLRKHRGNGQYRGKVHTTRAK